MEVMRHVRGMKPSTNTLKQRNIIKEEDICCVCKKTFKKYFLEIEHEVPVSIGGKIEEVRIICRDCHRKKSQKDVIIINFFKKMGFLEKIGQFEFMTPLSSAELRELYFLLLKLKDGLDGLDR